MCGRTGKVGARKERENEAAGAKSAVSIRFQNWRDRQERGGGMVVESAGPDPAAAPRPPRLDSTDPRPGWREATVDLGMLTVLEVTGAVSRSVPAPGPGPLIRVVVVIIGVVVGVLVGIVGVVAHHAIYVAGWPQIAELRRLWRRSPVRRSPW